MTYWTSTTSDFGNWAVTEGSFVDASQTFAADASPPHFEFEFVAEFFPARAAETVVGVAHSRVGFDERRESATPSGTDKFDLDNLIEPMIDAAETPQPLQPSEPPTLEDYLSS